MKTYFRFFILFAFAALSCQKNYEEREQVTIKQTIVFQANILETKSAVDALGKMTWTAGDSFAFYNTAGTKFEATISSGQGTANGTFTCSVFEGTLDSAVPAVYPYAYAGNAGKVVIPEASPWTEGTVPAIMASTVSLDGSTVNVNFHHLMSVVKLTLQDVPAYACAVKLSSATGQKLSGTYSVNAELNGVTLDDGSTSQIVYFPYKTAYGAEETAVICLPVPAYDYTDLTFCVLDGDETAIENTTKTVKATSSNLAVGDYLAMPKLNIRSMVGSARDGFVKVEGIKWAKGNLRAWKGHTTTGWQDGWGVYEDQWRHQGTYYSITNGWNTDYARNYSLNQSNYKAEDVFIHWDYFGWGTIGPNSRLDDPYVTPPSGSFEIEGKVYSGKSGSIPTTPLTGDARFVYSGFNEQSDLCGDVAFWASNGLYRLPSYSEMEKLAPNKGLASRANSYAGYYSTTVEGGGALKVHGILFTSSPSWDTVHDASSDNISFTLADLESGLFLPTIGQRSTGGAAYSAINVRNVVIWGVYWAGRSQSGGNAEAYNLNFGIAGNVQLSNGNAPTIVVSNTSVGHVRHGNAIRPVMVD